MGGEGGTAEEEDEEEEGGGWGVSRTRTRVLTGPGVGGGAREQAPRPAQLRRATTLRPSMEAIAPCPADAHVVRWGLRAGNLYSHSEYMEPL